MLSRSMLVLTFVVSSLMCHFATAQEPDLDRIARLERVAADLGALGMTAEATKYQSKATNERVVRDRRVKAVGNAMNVSRLLTNQIGQFQNAMTSGKFGRTELQAAARKLREKHQQLGKYLAALEFGSSPPVGTDFVASQPGNWEVLPAAKAGEFIDRPQPTVISTPTPAPQPTTNRIVSPVQEFSSPTQEFPPEFTEESL